ncbi:MAG: RnfH family protein [Gammaproteobacteria bacterium]|nr:RnfH family protein [Gammaproteobacteria bacterium]
MVGDDDRVEIYRPLELTPNEIRKLRAARRQATDGPGKQGVSVKRSAR